jgi:hypothetical protein
MQWKTTLAIVSALLAIAFAFGSPQPVQGNVCKVTGVALDEQHVPVAELMIEAWPLGVAIMGTIPRTKTDSTGHFVFNLPCSPLLDGSLRRYALYAHDEPLYYPDLASQFYSTDASHSEIVELSPDYPEMTVDLKLGPRAGAITGNVTDAVTGKPVKPYFQFAWASDPRNRMGRSAVSTYRILLPSNTGITFWVAATGYKRYSYPGAINVGSGDDFKLDIHLQPYAQQ